MSVLRAIIAGAKGLARRFEGWRAKPYLCPARVWTQGWGHTGPDVQPDNPPWSKEHGEAVLDDDVEVYARALLKLSPNVANLPAGVGSALTDFCFNLGTTRYKASTLRRKVAEEDWEAAAEQLGRWVFAAGRKLRGLEIRREAEAELLLAAVRPATNDNRPAADARAELAAELRRLLDTSEDPIGDLLKLLQGREQARAA